MLTLLLLTPAHMHFLYTILYAEAQRHEHFKSSLSGSSFQQGSVTPALCLLATTDNYSSWTSINLFFHYPWLDWLTNLMNPVQVCSKFADTTVLNSRRITHLSSMNATDVVGARWHETPTESGGFCANSHPGVVARNRNPGRGVRAPLTQCAWCRRTITAHIEWTYNEEEGSQRKSNGSWRNGRWRKLRKLREAEASSRKLKEAEESWRK